MKTFLTQYRWLVLIIIVAFALRLHNITNPVADWHSWRQADTASVTNQYVKNGIDLLRPTYHDLSNIPSGKNNLEGYRMVEFPFLNGIVAWLVIAFGLPLVETSRLLNIFMSLGTLISLYLLVKKVSGERIALASAGVFALLPYSIYYSRVILPEPGMLFLSTFSLMAFAQWLDTKKIQWYCASLIALAFALLLKPFVIFLAPVYGVLGIWHFRQRIILQPLLVIYGVLAAIPLLLWRDWIMQFPQGIPASDWLFNGNGIRLRPAWFRWLGWERLIKMQLGFLGIIFLPINFAQLKKDFWVYGTWWTGVGAYLIVIATGNVQHDYYQNLWVPILSISVGRGAILLLDWLGTKMPKHMAMIIVGILLSLSWWLAWQQVKGFFSVNHWEYVEAGKVVDQLTPADSLVIAPAFGDTQFLYQTNRQGWPIGTLIEEKIGLGATHYISTAKDDETNLLMKQYTVISETEKYVLIDLTKPVATSSAQPL